MEISSHQGFAPEAKLLVLACSHGSIETRATRLGELARVANCQSVVDLALAHGVAPPVFRALSSIDHRVDPEALERLRRFQRDLAVRNLALARELSEQLERFERAGLSALALKGPILALNAYGDVGARQFQDLDILVAARAYPVACELLASAGFELRQDWGYQASFRRKATTIDLHRQSGSPDLGRAVPFEDLWARRQVVRFAGRSIFTPGPEDTLILSCAELMGDGLHHRLTLQKVRDVAAASSSPRLEWAEVRRRARRFGCLRHVAGGLAVAQALVGLDAPTDRLPPPPRFSQRVTRAIFDADGPKLPTPLELLRFSFELRALSPELARQTLAIGARLIAPNEHDRELIHLPRRLEAFYYGVRPVRLVLERIRKQYSKAKSRA
ncbi:MAG: nucleotidyltransferase family protein [Deltaproteobacteria bacterium]|nr:nucleotidyltransferase family protein [Deltaproteobacteria bacterium]